MVMRRQCIGFVVVLISSFAFCSCQDELVKPTFPDVFRVEVQGIFKSRESLSEVDGSLYYDKPNNRAALFSTYQNESKRYIYNFDDDQYIQIEGSVCTITKITPEEGAVFFPFTLKKNKKVLASPEEVFYFSNSTLDRQELLSIFPSYVYTAKLNFPNYGLSNCDVVHIFSKPEVELPDCENHACKPTLAAISVKCLDSDGKTALLDHTYNFFRFLSGIADTSVFQPPVGVFCPLVNHYLFPGFPVYFSFSYDLIEEKEYSGADSGVFTIHKRVWYDSKLRLIRMDEFDGDGLLSSSRIFDFYGGTAYTIIASLSMCEPGPLDAKVALDEMTRLPKIFFKKNVTEGDAVYVGKRNVQGLDYETWSLTYTDEETDAMIVQEFYFTKKNVELKPFTNEWISNNRSQSLENSPNAQEPEKFQISHANIYTYERNDKTRLFELSVFTRVSINTFRSKPKEWEAFDISSCFNHERKKGFKLKVQGPPIVKNSRTYEEILELMYVKLSIVTNVSIIRINELTGVFDGEQITEFTGWILSKSQTENSKTGKREPDMEKAYRLIEDAAAAGKLSIELKKDGEEIKYVVTAIENVINPNDGTKDCYSAGTLAATSLVLSVIGFIVGVVLVLYIYEKKKKESSP